MEGYKHTPTFDYKMKQNRWVMLYNWLSNEEGSAKFGVRGTEDRDVLSD